MVVLREYFNENAIKIWSLTIIPTEVTGINSTTMDDGRKMEIKETYDINGILIVDAIATDGNVVTKAFRSNSNVLSSEEIETMRANMEASILVSPEDEKYRALIARAERVYEESFDEHRGLIMVLLMSFRASLERRDPIKVKETYKQLSDLLDRLEY